MSLVKVLVVKIYSDFNYKTVFVIIIIIFFLPNHRKYSLHFLLVKNFSILKERNK